MNPNERPLLSFTSVGLSRLLREVLPASAESSGVAATLANLDQELESIAIDVQLQDRKAHCPELNDLLSRLTRPSL